MRVLAHIIYWTGRVAFWLMATAVVLMAFACIYACVHALRGADWRQVLATMGVIVSLVALAFGALWLYSWAEEEVEGRNH